jgi:hypothetical protein
LFCTGKALYGAGLSLLNLSAGHAISNLFASISKYVGQLTTIFCKEPDGDEAGNILIPSSGCIYVERKRVLETAWIGDDTSGRKEKRFWLRPLTWGF